MMWPWRKKDKDEVKDEAPAENKGGGFWPYDTFPTKGGGHTYLGFVTEKAPSPGTKGIVTPVPSGNFRLLTEEDQESFRKGFAEKGYELVV